MSKEAPGHLELVRAFVNTFDVESGTDELIDGPAAHAWFVAHGLVTEQTPPVEPSTLASVRETREALRRLLELGPAVDEGTLAVLNRAADAAGLTVRFDGDGARVAVTSEGVGGAVGELLAYATGAMRDGSWDRLKVCERETCRWAFYDSSRNRSAKWCSMEVCGNRTKVEAYRERRS